MKLKELIKKLNIISATADSELEISGVSYDSRKTQPGDLFVAVKGLETDGHKYIPTAIKKGAAAILCEDIPAGDVPYVQTDDCRLGLALAGSAFFGEPSSKMTVIGITGTNGKTTSSYLIKHMLEEKLGAKVGLVGTNGNMIGSEFLHSDRTTPESFELQKLFSQMVDAGCTHVVMEVSSHSIVLERVAGIHFDVAVYTNLSQDHLDFHKTMEAYAEAKRKLFSVSDRGVMNLDDGWAEFMMEGAACPFLTFTAEDKNAALRAENVELSATGVRFDAVYGDEKCVAALAIPGMFSVHNALGVIGCGLELGLSLADCTEALKSAKGVKGRVEIVPTDGDYSILIDYAHTPDALENVLKTLKPVTKGRLIALFGCGGDRDRAKRPIMGAIGAENSDLCIITSDNPRTEDPVAIIDAIVEGVKDKNTAYEVIVDRIEAIHRAIDIAGDGDVILLAGKGHEDYQEICHVKHHMDEREIVADYLRERK